MVYVGMNCWKGADRNKYTAPMWVEMNVMLE